MRKMVLLTIALSLLLIPAGGHAETTTYTAPYKLGPKGGDSANHFFIDAEQGTITVVRVQAAGISGSLGCGGNGGFAYFAVDHDKATAVRRVTVSYDRGAIDPYTWMNVSVRKDGRYVSTSVQRGLLVGEGSVSVELTEAVTGPLTVWFGIQIASACPNVDGGSARFTAVTISD